MLSVSRRIGLFLVMMAWIFLHGVTPVGGQTQTQTLHRNQTEHCQSNWKGVLAGGKSITCKELQIILEDHKKWLETDGKQGKKASFREAVLYGINLRDSDLRKADLYMVNLSQADLNGALLGEADLSRADLSRADLSRADLTHANLSQANLNRADLTHANLQDSPLDYANLSNATLVFANLTNSHL